MPEEFEILDPEETLYQASRAWTLAAQDWEAAVEWLPRAILTTDAFGLAYHPESHGHVRTYNDCARAIRTWLAEGAETMHAAARALRRCAADYVEIDQELTARVDGLLDPVPDALPPAEPDRWHGSPGTYQ